MKKLLFLFILMMIGSVQGAYQYGNLTGLTVATDPYTNKYFEGTHGNYYTPIVTEKTSLYLVDHVNSKYSQWSANQNRLTSKLKDFGYVDASGNRISWTGETILANSIQMNQWNDLVTQNAYKIGEFDSSDTIKLWMQNYNNEISYSNTPKWSNYQGGYGLNGMDVWGNTLAKIDFDTSGSVFFSMAGTSSPSGQPLPGPMVTLLISGAMVAGIGLKNKLKRAK